MGRRFPVKAVAGLLLLAAVATATGVVVTRSAGKGTEAAGERLTSTVRRGSFEVSVTSIGALMAARSAILTSPFEGKIIKIMPEGSRVEKGETVIWFETTDLEEQAEEDEAQSALDEKDLQAAEDAFQLERSKNQFTLESEKTRVEIQRQQFEDARQKYEAEKILYERDISPETKLEESRLALLSAQLSLQNAQINLAKVEENLAANLRVREREIEKAKLRVEDTRRKVAEARERIDSAAVKANTPGDISYLTVWKGGSNAKVAEGDQVWRTNPLVEIPDTSEMHAVIPVNELDVSQVEKGQRAEVRLEALPGQAFAAVVESKSIVPITDQQNQAWRGGSGSSSGGSEGPREFEVRVKLEQTNEAFRQGMTASARIVVAELPDALQVPLESIFKKKDDTGVYVQRATGSEFVPVKVVLSNDNFAAVEGALSEGDQLLLGNPDDEAQPAVEIAVKSAAPKESKEGDPKNGDPKDGDRKFGERKNGDRANRTGPPAGR